MIFFHPDLFYHALFALNDSVRMIRISEEFGVSNLCYPHVFKSIFVGNNPLQ